jgi:hypothetical protein
MRRGRQLGLSHAHERRQCLDVNPDALGDNLVGDSGVSHPQCGGVGQR